MCQSFGWYLEQNDMLSYWDYDKNIVDPYMINSQINKKIWIKCLKNINHPSYEVSGFHFLEGTRCPYCRGLKVVPQESLASICNDIDLIWSDKNDTSPEEYTPHSNKSVWWKCKNGLHEDFYRPVIVMNNQNFHCPRCSDENKSSYLQSMVKSYFQELGYTVKNEGDCSIVSISPITGRKLPYDNEIVELKLITEVHGIQHYKPQICSWYKHGAIRDGLTLEEYIQRRKYCDDYKKEYALKNGYSFLEIPYWTEKNDEYKELINQKIKEIV